MRERPPRLEYGTDAEPPGHRAGRFAAFASFVLAGIAGGAVVTVVLTAISLAAAAAIIVGIVLIVRACVDPTFSAWYAAAGAGLFIAGVTVLLLLKRYDLDA